jgi:hypothetical protein
MSGPMRQFAARCVRAGPHRRACRAGHEAHHPEGGRSPGGRSRAQQSRGEFASAVSTTRARHAALSKPEDVAKIQLSSRPGPQPFQSRTPSRHPARLQAQTLCRVGRVARRRGLMGRLGAGMLRHAQTTRSYSDSALCRDASAAFISADATPNWKPCPHCSYRPAPFHRS